MGRRIAAAGLAVALVLAGCGSGGSGMSAHQAVLQAQADIRASGLLPATGVDAQVAALAALGRRMAGQVWPAYARVYVDDVVSRAKEGSAHFDSDMLGLAMVDLGVLAQDLNALKSTLQKHGG